jgi:hypothetical protein
VGQGGKSLPEENEQRSDRRLAERLILSPPVSNDDTKVCNDEIQISFI